MRPPILLIALLTPCAAPLKADPSDDVTLERPSEAFDCTLDAVSFDFAAASLAASVVEACRLVVWRPTRRNCRSISRDGAAADIEIKSPNMRCLESEKRNGNWVQWRSCKVAHAGPRTKI